MNQRTVRIVAIAVLSLLALILTACGGVVQASGNPNSDWEPVTICHATGNGSYIEITPSTEGAYNGHANQHEDDIIPAPADGCPDGDDGGNDDGGNDDEDECYVNEVYVCDDDEDDDNGGNPVVTVEEDEEEAWSAVCIDVFHPFIGITDFGGAPTAQHLQNIEWAGADTDLTDAWRTQFMIVPADYDPADRDLVRPGNDAGMLCADAIEGLGPVIVGFQLPDGSIAGIVHVMEIGGSVVFMDEAVIYNGNALAPDPMSPIPVVYANS